jgi:hypothetical protein
MDKQVPDDYEQGRRINEAWVEGALHRGCWQECDGERMDGWMAGWQDGRMAERLDKW